MLAGRGVALGLGARMNLTDLSKGLSAQSAAAHYYRKQQAARRSSEGARKRSNVALGLGSAYRPSPLRHPQRAPLAQVIDVDSEAEYQKESLSMAQVKASQEKQQQSEEKKKVTVKKAFDRSTFWVACRAVFFGTLLLLLGAAMCTIGYYNEHFAMEIVHSADNVTAMAPNPTKKFQFQSLTYIGPVIMGAGAFVLMMACVTTLESRDRQARIQAQLDAERTPLSRRNTGSRRGHPSAPSSAPGPSALKPSVRQTLASTADPSSSEPERGIRKVGPPKTAPSDVIAKPASYQSAELVTATLVAVPAPPGGDGPVTVNAQGAVAGGVENRCFTRDDSKTASKPETDSGPSGATTTTLAWSKNGGPRCEMDAVSNKYPSTSYIDNLIRKPDERALLQRFLEDQSRLVEDRLSRRPPQQGQKEAIGAEDGFRSASLDAPASAKIVHSCSRNFRSEEMAPRKNVVAAEVHHAGDASPGYRRGNPTTIAAEADPSISSTPFTQAPSTPEFHFVNPSTSTATIRVEVISEPMDDRLRLRSASELRAPVIAPNTFEMFSPMSVSPDTPASTTKQLSKSQILSPTCPPAAPSRPRSPDIDRSISGSYVTVVDSDDFGASVDFLNANTNTPCVYNTFSNPYTAHQTSATADPAHTKLYDSVFLAESLRRMASTQQPPRYDQELPSADYTNSPKEAVLGEAGDRVQPEVTVSQKAGATLKDWKEMNANYLRSQEKL